MRIHIRNTNLGLIYEINNHIVIYDTANYYYQLLILQIIINNGWINNVHNHNPLTKYNKWANSFVYINNMRIYFYSYNNENSY